MEERLWASIVHEHNARHLEIFGRRQAPSINSHQWEAESIIGQQCSDYIDPDAHAWIIQQAHYLRVEVILYGVHIVPLKTHSLMYITG